ncbi:hypothetical protein PSU4_22530 [Pseudonocardia sulfidoxydans NBRC 16205]|uniref:Uncharacterized protein n=1 Tax=Pseudonocardia sulfidoxydans NBRC 16205 TaxID=1223511 RepID=A0A511DES7_9PSEU|nr:hypothetical protein PSU4_22530 [Pseudonocardia sulfidoxydans NBRC 16205]
MRRPAAPGSARERDGRTRRAGAGRADAGKDRTKDTADDGSRDAKGSLERPRGEDTGRAERLPAQPGRAGRETRRAAGEASPTGRDGTGRDGTGRGRTGPRAPLPVTSAPVWVTRAPVPVTRAPGRGRNAPPRRAGVPALRTSVPT